MGDKRAMGALVSVWSEWRGWVALISEIAVLLMFKHLLPTHLFFLQNNRPQKKQGGN